MQEIKIINYISAENIWEKAQKEYDEGKQKSHHKFQEALSKSFGSEPKPYKSEPVWGINHQNYMKFLEEEIDAPQDTGWTCFEAYISKQAQDEILRFYQKNHLDFEGDVSGPFFVVDLKNYGTFLTSRDNGKHILRFEADASFDSLINRDDYGFDDNAIFNPSGIGDRNIIIYNPYAPDDDDKT